MDILKLLSILPFIILPFLGTILMIIDRSMEKCLSNRKHRESNKDKLKSDRSPCHIQKNSRSGKNRRHKKNK